jgi:1,2-diacylglycerol 3-alpha-glucosyltransferase
MRIAYVCPRYPPQIGGVETHVSEIATRLASQGHEVEVLSLAEGTGEAPREVDGVTVRRFRPGIVGGRGMVPLSLWRYLSDRKGRWDVVHAHVHASPPAVAAALARAGPLVFTPHYHGFWRSWQARVYRALIRPRATFVFRRSDRVICVSESESTRLLDEFPSIAGRVVVIPNGTSRRRARTEGRQPQPLVLSLGRLEEYKHVDAVVAALVHLPPEFRLEVIGDGSARPALTEFAVRNGVRQRVDFLGRVNDERVDRALAESGVLVTMSELEAFSLAPLDALAAGLPVVASDIPAHRELRDRFGTDRVTLVPQGAPPEQLAGEISKAAAQGRGEPPADLPTWDRVAEMTLDLYGDVVAMDRRDRG